MKNYYQISLIEIDIYNIQIPGSSLETKEKFHNDKRLIKWMSLEIATRKA